MIFVNKNERIKVYFNALLEGHQKSDLDETFGLIEHKNYPIGNPRFPMKYILLNWTCEYDGHYNLDVEVNQIENNDVPGNLIEVRFRLKGGSDVGDTVLSTTF